MPNERFKILPGVIQVKLIVTLYNQFLS